jgi:hypothetical protein
VKRDFELVFKILEHLEKRNDVSMLNDLLIEGYDETPVRYHLNRMYEAGLLDAETSVSSTTPKRLIRVYPFGLSWDGHEFLDSVRQRGVKDKLKTKLGGAIVDVPFSVLKGLALALTKDQLGF